MQRPKPKPKPTLKTAPAPSRKIAVVNLKGGVGKTTTAVNLSAALVELGEKVLVVDMDSQRNASRHLGHVDGPSDDKRLIDALTSTGRGIADLAETTPCGVDLVPGSRWLLHLDRLLALGGIGAETIPREAFETIPPRWGFVLVDCPTGLGAGVVAALSGCDEVVVPVETASTMSLDGLKTLLETVQTVRARLNPRIRLCGMLPCNVHARTRLAQGVIKSLRDTFGPDVFTTVIRATVRIGEANSYGMPVTMYDPTSTGAEDYRALAKELLSKAKGGTR